MRVARIFPIVFFLLAAQAAVASDLSLFAGWSQTGSLRSGPERIDLKNLSLFGVRYEKSFLLVFGFENSLAYTTNSLVAKGEGGSGGIAYTGNFVVSIPADNVAPFFTVGVGVLHKLEKSFPDVGSSFLVNYGLGAKFRRMAGPMGLRFDYRRFKLYNVLDETVSSNELSGGLVFSF